VMGRSSFVLLVAVLCLVFFCNQRISAEFSPDDIELITFDFYAALMNTSYSIQEDCLAILANTFPQATILNLVDNWMSEYDSLEQINSLLQDRGVQWASDDLFLLMLQTTLEGTLQLMGLSLSPDLFDQVVDTFNRLKPWENTLFTLLQLRNATKMVDGQSVPRFKLGVLSNGDESGLSRAVQVLQPFTFDYILCSTTAGGYFKPSLQFYEQVLPILGDGDKRKHVHVAGAAFDALGAKLFGLNAIWNNEQNGDVYINLTGNPIYVPNATVTDIADILPLLLVSSSSS